MNTTTLCVLLCVVVGGYGFSIIVCSKKLGEKCGPVTLCCEGCCEDGICKNSTKCKYPKTCEELKCQPWQECFYPITHCEAGAGCSRQPFCRPRARIGIPKQLTTVQDPCAAVDCMEGFQCQSYLADCITPPCPPHLLTTCAPIERASVTKVMRQEREVYHDDPCSHVFCAGKVCQTDRVKCLVPPCPKLTARCVPREKTTAIAEPSIGHESEASPADPCSSVTCVEGYECKFVAANCAIPPCPVSSGPRCLPAEPFAYQMIPSPADPCATKVCREGFECRSYSADCISPPCPLYLLTTCAPKDDHPITEVTRYQREAYPDDPCSLVFCAGGNVCQTERVKCLIPPCPKPTARCVPRDERNYREPAIRLERDTFPDDPCVGVVCKEGHECHFVAVNCFAPPCPMASGPRCLPKRVTRYRRDSVRDDPCATVRCRGDHECKAITVQCFAAPCPKLARCVPKKYP